MIRNLLIPLLLVSATVLVATEKITVFVSIPPQKYIIEEIAGDVASVKSLLSENDNPHSFTVSPSMVKVLSNSDAYFQIGIPFESVIIAKIIGSGMKLDFFRHDEGIARRHVKTEHKCSSGCVHHGEETDPHFWISAENVIKMAENSSKILTKLKPELKTVFEANLARFKKKNTVFNESMTKALLPHKGKGFYVYHPAFGYFADSYGLIQNAVEVEGKKPSPRQLNKLINKAKKDGIKTIIVQNQFDRRAAERLASVIGGNVVEINPMKEDVPELLQSLGDAILKGFGN